jgi:hypothetical protein
VRNIGESGLPRPASSSCHCSTEKRKIEWGWELLKRDDFSSSIVVNLVLSLYNQMASPVDVGGLANHVKYCVSVLSFQWPNIITSPVGIPYTIVFTSPELGMCASLLSPCKRKRRWCMLVCKKTKRKRKEANTRNHHSPVATLCSCHLQEGGWTVRR